MSHEHITELLRRHADVSSAGPHPRGYCSVAFRAIRAEYHAEITAWVEQDGIGHRAFHTGRGDGERPTALRSSEPFWIIPRARLALE